MGEHTTMIPNRRNSIARPPLLRCEGVTNGKTTCAGRQLNASSENFNAPSYRMLLKESVYGRVSILAPEFIVDSVLFRLAPTDVDRGPSCKPRNPTNAAVLRCARYPSFRSFYC
jgi:hypothetical protein